MKILNYTPRKITIIKANGEHIAIEPSGNVARVSTFCEELPSIGGIPVFKSHLGELINMPPIEEGTIYIVSQIVKNASGREDLYFPADLVRDENGVIIGCKGLAK